MDHAIAYESFAPPNARAQLLGLVPPGAPKVLFSASKDPDLQHRLTLDPNGRWLIIAQTGGDADRVGLFDLHTEHLRWLPAPGEGLWSISDPVLSEEGDRLCVSARPVDLPLNELFIYGLNDEEPVVLAGVALNGSRRNHSPVFLPGGQQLLFVQSGGDDPGELHLLELDRVGTSARGIQGQAPSVRSLRITHGANVHPNIGLAHCAKTRRTVFAVPVPVSYTHLTLPTKA